MRLPQWLDNYIYNDLGAKYCRSNADITVIDWDKNDVLNYLGTYFPRSYAEAYSIFAEYFKNNTSAFANIEELSIFDFGCGTGGEIIGLLTVLSELRPNLKVVRMVALDGNKEALLLYEEILNKWKERTNLQVISSPIHLPINFYKLEVLDNVMTESFDIIISFKAICEFVTKVQFEQKNAYEQIASFLLPKLSNDGRMLLVDVTSYNNTSQEWLPMMMDKGLKATNCNVIARNIGYNQTYTITHSQQIGDISKVAWRMIKQ